ncbi:hypothetical protein Tco_1442222, partial [Tanacetum coccineum]
MTTLKFTHTHNLVAFLEKPTKSAGFEEIVDFLNAHPIKYDLTVNHTIYTSCIEQFWSTVKAKTVNEEVQLQALTDGKKIIVSEASVRHDLQLHDEEGMDCLPNATIFEELARMGMVKNLDNENKFLMYPRFVQVFLEKQVGDMSNQKRIYVTPSYTKKIFRNMKRVGKSFSGRETPLFPTMMPSSSQPQKKQKSRKPKRKDTEVPQPSGPTNITDEAVNEENASKHSNDPLLSDEDSIKLNELIELCTKLQQRVLDLENTKTSQAQEITSLKRKEDASKQGRIIDIIDKDAEVTLVNETQGGNDEEMFDTDVLNDDDVGNYIDLMIQNNETRMKKKENKRIKVIKIGILQKMEDSKRFG